MSFSGRGSVISMNITSDGDTWFYMSGIDSKVCVHNDRLRKILIDNIGSGRELNVEGYMANGNLHVTSIY